MKYQRNLSELSEEFDTPKTQTRRKSGNDVLTARGE
jgi:hypothetical protein